MTKGINFYDQAVKNNLRTYDNIGEAATGEGDDYTTSCLLLYPYFKMYYNMIAIDLSKQQSLDANQKTIRKINFTVNLHKESTMLSFIEEAKEIILDFSQRTVITL